MIKNGVVTAVTANDFQPEMVNNTINRKVDHLDVRVECQWKPTTRWTLTGDVYRSRANRPGRRADTFVTAGLVTNAPYADRHH